MVTTEDFFEEVVLEALSSQLWDVTGKYVNTGLIVMESSTVNVLKWG